MKNGLALLAGCVALLIAGCATSPEGVIKEGEQFDYPTALTPYAASICIARNARSFSSTTTGEERLLGESSTEVAVRSGGDTLAIAQIHRGAGVMSRVSIWVGRSVGADRRRFAQHLMTGC